MADREKPDEAYLDEMIDESFPASDAPSYSGTTAGAPMHRPGNDERPVPPPSRGKGLGRVVVAAVAVAGAAVAFLLRRRFHRKKRGWRWR